MYNIDEETMKVILYFIDDWLRLMGFGGEYRKLANLANELEKSGVDISKYHYIKLALGKV